MVKIKMSKICISLIQILFFFTISSIAQESIEHLMVKKMPGFELVETLSKKSDFSTFSFRIIENKKTTTIEKKGKYWKLHYENRNDKGKIGKKISKIDIMNNYRFAAKEMGGEVFYAERGKITFTLPLNGSGKLWGYVTALDGNYDLIIIEEEGFEKQ